MKDSRVNFRTERRFSIKILSGKVRGISNFLYWIIIEIRFIFFRRRCQGSVKNILNYSDGSWVERKTTRDLKLIIQYLLNDPRSFNLFQAGIGNSDLFIKTRHKLDSFVGITIVEDEARLARNCQRTGAQYEVILGDKYLFDYSHLKGKFDFIVDNDLSSYACCKFHFEQMLKSYQSILQEEGKLLVGLKGLGYFDNGFGLSEANLRKFADRCGFKVVKNNYCYELMKM